MKKYKKNYCEKSDVHVSQNLSVEEYIAKKYGINQEIVKKGESVSEQPQMLDIDKASLVEW